jgi:hypothetical protein
MLRLVLRTRTCLAVGTPRNSGPTWVAIGETLRPSFRPLDAAGNIAARCPYLLGAKHALAHSRVPTRPRLWLRLFTALPRDRNAALPWQHPGLKSPLARLPT